MGHVQIPGHIWVSLMYVCKREVHSGLLSYHYVHGADALQFLCPRIPMTFIEHRRFDRSKSAPPGDAYKYSRSILTACLVY